MQFMSLFTFNVYWPQFSPMYLNETHLRILDILKCILILYIYDSEKNIVSYYNDKQNKQNKVPSFVTRKLSSMKTQTKYKV